MVYKFGDENTTSFYQALKEAREQSQYPWLWDDIAMRQFTNNGAEFELINRLTDEERCVAMSQNASVTCAGFLGCMCDNCLEMCLKLMFMRCHDNCNVSIHIFKSVWY